MSEQSKKEVIKKGGSKMAIMTADCKKAFVVDPEKAVQFKERKCSKYTAKKISDAARKINKNIKVEIGK